MVEFGLFENRDGTSRELEKPDYYMSKITIARQSEEPIKVLIIDDEDNIYQYCINHIEEGFAFEHHNTGHQALEIINNFDLVLLDKNFAQNSSEALLGGYENRNTEGLTILKAIRKKNKLLPVIMVTACADYESASRAMSLGAFDYVEWDALLIDPPQILLTKMLRAAQFEKQTKRNWMEQFSKMGLVGRSEAMMKIYEQVELASRCDLPVLLTGPSGTGKTIIANIIHSLSDRKTKPFVEVSLPSLTDEMATSELFGAAKGAATGVENKRGRFKEAHRGTLFLEEIGDIDTGIQVRLLKAVEEGKIEPLGKPAEEVDARIIAATNQDLEEKISKGEFRPELYHRLKVMEITLPPLSERPDDIIPLAEHFIASNTDRDKKEIVGLTSDAKDYLKSIGYEENNVRELKNLIDKACNLSDMVIGINSLVKARRSVQSKDSSSEIFEFEKIDISRSSLDNINKVAIIATLRRTGGNKKEAAKSLGISEASIYNKIKGYSILSKDYN
ncbi:MAG: response regulator [candidate division Zixibacteria bacterium]|nr:response regulator [candidate division Zixibacteria bacterium]